MSPRTQLPPKLLPRLDACLFRTLQEPPTQIPVHRVDDVPQRQEQVRPPLACRRREAGVRGERNRNEVRSRSEGEHSIVAGHPLVVQFVTLDLGEHSPNQPQMSSLLGRSLPVLEPPECRLDRREVNPSAIVGIAEQGRTAQLGLLEVRRPREEPQEYPRQCERLSQRVDGIVELCQCVGERPVAVDGHEPLAECCFVLVVESEPAGAPPVLARGADHQLEDGVNVEQHRGAVSGPRDRKDGENGIDQPLDLLTGHLVGSEVAEVCLPCFHVAEEEVGLVGHRRSPRALHRTPDGIVTGRGHQRLGCVLHAIQHALVHLLCRDDFQIRPAAPLVVGEEAEVALNPERQTPEVCHHPPEQLDPLIVLLVVLEQQEHTDAVRQRAAFDTSLLRLGVGCRPLSVIRVHPFGEVQETVHDLIDGDVRPLQLPHEAVQALSVSPEPRLLQRPDRHIVHMLLQRHAATGPEHAGCCDLVEAHLVGAGPQQVGDDVTAGGANHTFRQRLSERARVLKQHGPTEPRGQPDCEGVAVVEAIRVVHATEPVDQTALLQSQEGLVDGGADVRVARVERNHVVEPGVVRDDGAVREGSFLAAEVLRAGDIVIPPRISVPVHVVDEVQSDSHAAPRCLLAEEPRSGLASEARFDGCCDGGVTAVAARVAVRAGRVVLQEAARIELLESEVRIEGQPPAHLRECDSERGVQIDANRRFPGHGRVSNGLVHRNPPGWGSQHHSSCDALMGEQAALLHIGREVRFYAFCLKTM